MLASNFYKDFLISIYSLENKQLNSRYFGRYLWVAGSVFPLIDTLKIIAEYNVQNGYLHTFTVKVHDLQFQIGFPFKKY